MKDGGRKKDPRGLGGRGKDSVRTEGQGWGCKGRPKEPDNAEKEATEERACLVSGRGAGGRRCGRPMRDLGKRGQEAESSVGVAGCGMVGEGDEAETALPWAACEKLGGDGRAH